MPTKMKFHLRPKTKRNENENGHSFSAEKRKWKSPDNISVYFPFHTFSHHCKSALQCAANTSSRFAFLQVVLVDGIPLSSCAVYRYLCGIFLDDISTRKQFAFLVYCYRVKSIFHNLCTVLYCAYLLCGLTNSPHCYIPSQLMCMERRRFSQTMASEWQTAFVISHKMPWCALLDAVKNYNKSWKPKDFFFVTETKTLFMFKTKTKTFIFVIEAPQDQDPGLEDYITAIFQNLKIQTWYGTTANWLGQRVSTELMLGQFPTK